LAVVARQLPCLWRSASLLGTQLGAAGGGGMASMKLGSKPDAFKRQGQAW